MRTVSAVLAALLSVTALAPAAFATHPNTADARVGLAVPAAVGSAVTADGPLSATVDSLDGVPLGAGSDLRAQVTATNLTDTALDEVVLRLGLTREPLTSRQELADFMADPASLGQDQAVQEPPALEPDDEDAAEVSAHVTGSRLSEPGAAADFTTDSPGDAIAADTGEADQEPPDPVGLHIAPGAQATFTLTASSADLGLPADGWGVYGASLTLVTQDEEVLVDSFPVTYGAQAVPQLDLAVLATAQGVPSRVISVLEAADVPGVAVAVDPTHLTTANVMSVGLNDREVFRLPVHDPDLTSIAHSDNDNLLPLALSLPGATVVSTVTSAPWLAIPAVMDAQSVTLATDHGASGVLALPSATGFDRIRDRAEAPVISAQGTPVLVPDAALSDTVAQFRPGTPAAAALTVADSALLASDSEGLPAFVALSDEWHIGAGSQANLTALMDAPWVESLPVTELLEQAEQSVPLSTDLDIGDNLSPEQIDRLGHRLDQLTLLATVAESPEAALNEWGRDLLRGITVATRGNPLARDRAVDNAIARAQDTLSALRIAESSDLNLLTETGDIPVNVVNGLDHAVTVTVNLHSFSSNLQVLDSPTVTVPAATDQVVLVPVEAVSTANVFIAAELRNADAEAVSDTQPFSVRVRADWGNAATAVFTVILVLLLVAGLVRTVRRGRKDTRVDPSSPPETMTGEHD